jgi:hypothetical protein
MIHCGWAFLCFWEHVGLILLERAGPLDDELAPAATGLSAVLTVVSDSLGMKWGIAGRRGSRPRRQGPTRRSTAARSAQAPHLTAAAPSTRP